MESEIKIVNDSAGVVDVPGFTADGVHCDVRGKGDDRMDVAAIVSEAPCDAAGVFTVSRVRAAPVRYSAEVLKEGGPIHAIVANSGNANACTGEQGLADARKMAAVAAEILGRPAGSVLVGSTGRIGEPLPMERIEAGVREAVASRGNAETNGRRAAEALLTSDTRTKTVTARFEWNGRTVTIAGVAKGAGMIEPNMATMLAFIATDVAAGREFLAETLRRVTDRTFNRITIDGDMSTNDTVFILANGASGVSVEDAPDARPVFEEVLYRVCQYLADQIVSDGEKITKVVEVNVTGAASAVDAERAARAIGNSLLVKCAWFGEDPNWGRLAGAAGSSGAEFDGERLDIHYDDVPVVRRGVPIPENKPRWIEVVKQQRFAVTLNLNSGESDFRLLATDLTEGYVRYNKSE